jgi:hypothetical protein
MLARRPEAERRLDTARDELAAAEAAAAAISARENTELADPVAYKIWQSEHDAAVAEVKRRRKLVASIEDQTAREGEQQAAAALQKRITDAKKNNELIAARMRDEGVKAAEVLLRLTRDNAQAEAETATINSLLPPDASPITSAEVLARARPAMQREEISEKKTELWVFESTGAIVGAQGDVQVASDGTGTLPSGAHGRLRIKCVRKQFRSVQYREAEPAARVEPIVTALRLPDFAGPGLLWDGPRISHPSKALAAFDQLSQANQSRPVLTELVPIDDATDKPPEGET